MIRSAASSNHELTTRGGLTQPLGLLTGGAGFVVGVAYVDPSGFWHHLACSALKHRKKIRAIASSLADLHSRGHRVVAIFSAYPQFSAPSYARRRCECARVICC